MEAEPEEGEGGSQSYGTSVATTQRKNKIKRWQGALELARPVVAAPCRADAQGLLKTGQRAIPYTKLQPAAKSYNRGEGEGKRDGQPNDDPDGKPDGPRDSHTDGQERRGRRGEKLT